MTRWLVRRIGVAALLMMGFLGAAHSVAQAASDQLLFGPKQYVRVGIGAPTEYTDTITVPTSVSDPFLLHIVNGQANGQNRVVSSAWISVNGVQVAGPADFAQNVSMVDRTVTLQPGTNTITIKLASVPNSYLTISVFGTKILPTPTTLSPNPLSLTVGSSGTLTATISPSPTTAGSLAVASNNTSIATVPGSVSFAIGQTSIPIPVSALSVGNSQVTVSLNGGSASAVVDVSAVPPTVASLQPPTETVTQGGTGSLTVTISAVQASATTVTLSSSVAGIASVPATITVPAGQTSAPIAVAANTAGTAVITASLNGSSAQSTITVTPNLPTIVSLLPATTSVDLGASGSLTVKISAVQSSATTIQVTASPSGLVSVPATVIVPAGQLTATVPFTSTALGTAMIQASLNGSSATSAVQVTPPPPAVVSLLPSPLPLVVGANGTLMVTINIGQQTNTEVAIAVDQPTVVQVPAIVTVPAGQTQANFTVTALGTGSATVTATLNGTSKSAVVQVQPPPPQVISLLPNPLPLQQGATGSFTLTINAAQLNDTTVPLSNSAPSIVQIPPTVTIPANQLSAAIPVTALLAGSATISASINSSTTSSVVQVTPPPPVVASLTTIPPDPPGSALTRPKGAPGTLRVTLNRAPTDVTVVPLTSSATSVAQVPATVTVAAGALTADFPVNTVGEGTATITASLNGGSATATVTVIPAAVVMLTLSPQNPTLYQGQQQQMTAMATLTDGTTPDYTSQVAWTSSNQTVATITSGGLLNALAIGTSSIQATFTPSGGGTPVSSQTILTVVVPPALTLTATPAAVIVGQSLTVTVTSAAPAGAGGLVVTLAAPGQGQISFPTTVTILENQSGATFTVQGVSMGQALLTATAPIRTPGSLTITVNPGVPTITSIAPTTGPVGTVVTITGTSFHPTGSENQIKFNGTSAIVSSATGTSLVTTVPQNATTGSVTVTTAQGTATGPTFTVVSPNFSLSALPAPLTVPAIGQGSFAVSLSGTGGFTNLATLSVTGLPTGMTALFNIGTIGSGQSSLLTLTTNGTTSTGTYPILVTATGAVNGVTTARTVTANVQVLATGATTFAGQVLDEEDKPVKGVLVKIGATQVSTDDGGNFLMPNAPVGANQLMFIDGTPASTPDRKLPVIAYKVTIVASQANAMTFVPHLHFQKTTGMVDISNTGVERIVTDPDVPGFQMNLPAGAQIIGWDGQPNTQVSIRRVALDRNPIPPLPGDRVASSAYMYYFGKDGGGTPSEPIPITFPNDLGAPPATQVELWFYDEAPDGSRPNQMAQYGTGTVSANGSQIVPDINPATGKQYGQPRFCCGYVMPAWLRAFMDFIFSQIGGGLGRSVYDLLHGDPVDVATGMFVMQKTDMVLPGRLPVTVTRTYRGMLTNQGPFGIGSSHTYDVMLRQEGDLRRLLLPGGERVLFPMQTDGTFKNLTDPAYSGAVITATGGNHILRFKDGATWTFGSPSLGLSFLTSQADRNGNTLTFTRAGATGTLTTITDSVGRQIQFTYTGTRITEISDPLGQRVSYSYDPQGRLAKVIDQEGGATQYTYDAQGRMLTITDARGIVFLQNFYGSSGRVLRQIQADGSEYKFRYQLVGATSSGPGCTPLNPPAGGGPITVTLPFVPCPSVDSWENFQAGLTVTAGTVTATTVVDPRGNATTIRFNGQGYPIDQTDALGQKTTMQRNAANQLLASTDPIGRVTKYEYDGAGNVKKIIDANNQPRQFEYHPTFNLVTKITDALNNVTEFTYDNTNGNLLTAKDPLNHVTTIAYNTVGQPISVQGPIATEPPTTFEYDTNGNLSRLTDALGAATQRTYDAVSRLTNLTDPRGLQTQFRYDGINRITEIADSRQGITRFTYDQNGNLLTVADSKNQTTTFTYDNMDRLKTRKDGVNPQEVYSYDANGNLATRLDGKNQPTTFEYDALNHRTVSTYPDGTTTLTYDALGRLMNISDTTSTSGAINLSYDMLDRLIQETTGLGTIAYQHDVLGRRTSMVANGQQSITYQYDAASRLTQVAKGSLSVGMGYDDANRRISLTFSNGTSASYAYDVVSRPTNILHQGPGGVIENLTYVYDTAGNGISLTRSNGAASLLPDAVASASYDPANQQTMFGGASLAYDANGNLTGDGLNTYVWDSRNRLVEITGGVSASFRYDPLGRRSSKTVNAILSQYMYDGNNVVAEVGGGAVGASYLRSLSIDEAFIRQSSTGNEFYHADALGSSIALSNSEGAAASNYQYEPFGKTTVTGMSANPFQYTGRENDIPDLYYYRARYYSPKFGRFVGADPFNYPSVQMTRRQSAGSQLAHDFHAAVLRNVDLWNAYAYVGNNPLSRLDPLGLWSIEGGGGAAIPLFPGGVGGSANIAIGGDGFLPDRICVGGGVGYGIGGHLSATFSPATPKTFTGSQVKASVGMFGVGWNGTYSIDRDTGRGETDFAGGVGVYSGIEYMPAYEQKCWIVPGSKSG